MKEGKGGLERWVGERITGSADVKRPSLWLGLEGGIDRQKEKGGRERESIWLMVGVMRYGGSV